MSNRLWIPKKYRQCALDDFPAPVRSMIEDVWNGFASPGLRGLVLEGSNGVGKTKAACGIAVEAWVRCRIPFKPAFVQANQVHDMWEQYDDFRGHEYKHTFRTAPLLIIDDLGKEDRVSDYMEQKACVRIGDILRHRVQNDLPTIVTTNANMEDLETMYGNSIVSLLHEMADKWLIVRGPDARKNRR